MYRSFSFEINKNISWKLVTVCLNLNRLVALGTCHRSTGMEDESLHLYFLYQHDPPGRAARTKTTLSIYLKRAEPSGFCTGVRGSELERGRGVRVCACVRGGGLGGCSVSLYLPSLSCRWVLLPNYGL